MDGASAKSDERPADPASSIVVRRVSSNEGCDAIELPPLYEAIEPDALDAVVESAASGASPVSIRFTYAGYEVTVRADEIVRVTIDEQ